MKTTRRLFSALLSLCLLLVLLPAPVQAATLTDIKGHWAESYIRKAVERGYVAGYDDNTFRPGNPITRAEFCKMLVGALGLSATANISFSDVAATQWFYKDVQKAAAAGFIAGYENGTFLPNNRITRQEAAVVIARLMAEPSSLREPTALSDYKTIADWARQGVIHVFSKGYMVGDNLKKFNPKGNLTRAEAVKIIESLLVGETLVKGNITVSEGGQSYSNRVFTGNVVISPAVGEGTVTFKNCRILGTLLVNGGGSTGIRLSNTGVANMTVDSKTAVGVAAVGCSTVNDTYLSTPATLTESQLTSMGEGFRNVTLGGDGHKSGSTLSGDYANVTLNTPCDVTLTGGTTDRLTVGAQAGGSEITLRSDAHVNTAVIKAPCGFFGAGDIDKAVKDSADVTFETAPGTITGSAAAGGLTLSVIPRDDTLRVPVDTDIVLTFSEAIRKKDGGTLTISYVQNNVALRRGSPTGTKVSLSPSISQSGKVLTLTPDSELAYGQRYYLVVTADAFRGVDTAALNAAVTTVFETEGSSSGAAEALTPVFQPGDGADNIPVQPQLTLTFDQKVYRANGSSLTTAYVQSTAIELRRDSRTGAKVDFSAAINTSGRILTLTPDDELDTDTTYYLILNADALASAGGDTNTRQIWSFTTADYDYAVPMAYPASGARDIAVDTSFTFVFDAAVYNASGDNLTGTYLENSVFTLRRGSPTGTKVAFTASRSSDNRTLTVTPDTALAADTAYYLTIAAGSMRDARYERVPALTFVYRTADKTTGGQAGKLAPNDTYPQQGARSAAADTKILLAFSSSLIQPDGSKMTAACLEEQVVELRRGSSAGTKVAFTLSMNASRDIVTITPTRALIDGETYYVILKAGTYASTSGAVNDKFVLSFTVGNGGELALEIQPERNTADVMVTYDLREIDEDVTLKITYAKKNGTTRTLIDYYSPGKTSGTEHFLLRDLTEESTYTVKATLTFENGETISDTKTFTTTSQSDDATLKAIKVYTATGGIYRAAFTKTSDQHYAAELSGAIAPSGRTIRLAAEAADKYSVIWLNSQMIESGEICEIPVTTDMREVLVTFTIRAQDGSIVTYSLPITLDWRNAQ